MWIVSSQCSPAAATQRAVNLGKAVLCDHVSLKLSPGGSERHVSAYHHVVLQNAAHCLHATATHPPRCCPALPLPAHRMVLRPCCKDVWQCPPRYVMPHTAAWHSMLAACHCRSPSTTVARTPPLLSPFTCGAVPVSPHIPVPEVLLAPPALVAITRRTHTPHLRHRDINATCGGTYIKRM
jgi:hypothetical protein